MKARFALALVVVAACSSRTVAPPPPDRSPVVAHVYGEPITADEIARVSRHERLEPRAALEQLIRDRLLVREGMREGLLTSEDADDARWRASVQLLLAHEVEDRESPATIPREFFEAIFQRRRVEFRHDGLVHVIHALAEVERGASGPLRDAARARAEAFRARLLATTGGHPTAAQFQALAEQMQLHFESIAPFDRTGQAADGATFQDSFVRVSWSLTDAAPVSQTFDTSYGVHVAMRTGSTPPLSRPVAEAQAAAMQEGLTVRRARALRTLLEDLRARVDIRVSEAAIGAGAVPSTEGAPATAAGRTSPAR